MCEEPRSIDQSLVVNSPGVAPDPDVSVVALEFGDPIKSTAAPLSKDSRTSGTLADPIKSQPAP
jgi:hypothetical protein